jgi:hypothetical protein
MFSARALAPTDAMSGLSGSFAGLLVGANSAAGSAQPAQSEFSSSPKAATKRRTMDVDSRRQDDELIARTQAGDAAAFDELIVKYSPRLYGLVYNMTSNHEDTHDLMQDIWSKAYRSISGFRGRSSF